MSPIIVRRAQGDDLAVVGHLGALLVKEHYDFDHQRFLEPIPDLADRYSAFLGSQLERPNVVLLVAEHDGVPVGYAFGAMEGNDYMALRGPAGEIYDLVVDPGHRRQGIGSMLLDAALAELATLGAPRAVLFTAAKNSDAQRLFERMGFRRTMIEMTRELGEP